MFSWKLRDEWKILKRHPSSLDYILAQWKGGWTLTELASMHHVTKDIVYTVIFEPNKAPKDLQELIGAAHRRHDRRQIYGIRTNTPNFWSDKVVGEDKIKEVY